MQIRRFLIATAAALALLSASCARPTPPERRLMLLPLENLSSDAGFDWASAAASAVLEYDLSGAPNLVVIRGDSVAALAGSGANHALEGYFAVERGQLAIHVSVQEGVKTVRTLVREGSVSAGFAPLLDWIAKEVSAQARPFCTRDPLALRAYGEALLAPDQAAKARFLRAAIVQDPKFSEAYQSLAGLLLSQGDRGGAADIATEGAHTAANALDRTELEYAAATARADLSGRERALTALTRQLPKSVAALRLLAEVHALERKYKAAIQDEEAVTRLDPRDPGTYNLTGYLYAYLHDLPNAVKSLREYQRLSPPNDPNPSDSLGEVHFLLGDFTRAEKYFREAHGKNPADGGGELRKAAQARLMTGDLAGADGIFDQCLAASRNAGPSAVELRRSQWEFLTGRRERAVARIENVLASASGDAAALAGSQLAVWRLQMGERALAYMLASEARIRAVSPGTRNVSAICQYLSSPVPGKSPVPLFDGLALVLAGQFGPAIPVFEQLLRQTPPAADGELRTLLAWCYVQTGRWKDAKPLVDLYPLLFPSPDAIFTSLTFPRFLQLRAAVLESEHSTAEAQRLGKLYREYAGPPGVIK